MQDVAERISREAKLRLYRPRVLAMDAYPMQQLTTERAVVFVTATAGQVLISCSCMRRHAASGTWPDAWQGDPARGLCSPFPLPLPAAGL